MGPTGGILRHYLGGSLTADVGRRQTIFMTEVQQTVWRCRIRSAAEFTILLLIGYGCVWLTRHLVGFPVRGLTAMVILFLPLVLYYTVRPSGRDEADSDAMLVPLNRFLEVQDAIFAPNLQEISAKISTWVTSFSDRHGPGSVYVKIQKGEENLTDTIYLIAPGLSLEDYRMIESLGSEGVRQISNSRMRHLIQGLSRTHKVFEVSWD